MLTVISPAKSLDLESRPPERTFSQPRLLDRAEALVDVMVEKSPADLSELMGISAELAELNVERFAQWHRPFDPSNARPALFTFAGDVYAGMDPAGTFDTRDLTEAQKTLRILSGLYGVLRPLDLMQPYRLEMGTSLETSAGGDLYGFWGDDITDVLRADLEESTGTPALVNLASQEYFRAVDVDRLDATVITPRFLDADDSGEYRIVSFFAKRARGAMAGWLVRERVKAISAIAEFDDMGYRYDPDRSTRDEPTFIRPVSAR